MQGRQQLNNNKQQRSTSITWFCGGTTSCTVSPAYWNTTQTFWLVEWEHKHRQVSGNCTERFPRVGWEKHSVLKRWHSGVEVRCFSIARRQKSVNPTPEALRAQLFTRATLPLPTLHPWGSTYRHHSWTWLHSPLQQKQSSSGSTVMLRPSCWSRRAMLSEAAGHCACGLQHPALANHMPAPLPLPSRGKFVNMYLLPQCFKEYVLCDFALCSQIPFLPWLQTEQGWQYWWMGEQHKPPRTCNHIMWQQGWVWSETHEENPWYTLQHPKDEKKNPFSKETACLRKKKIKNYEMCWAGIFLRNNDCHVLEDERLTAFI